MRFGGMTPESGDCSVGGAASIADACSVGATAAVAGACSVGGAASLAGGGSAAAGGAEATERSRARDARDEDIRNSGIFGFATQSQLRARGYIGDCGETVKARGGCGSSRSGGAPGSGPL